MKKTIILAALLLINASFLTSCSSEDNETEKVQEQNFLLGKWNGVSSHMKIEMDGNILIDNLDQDEGSMYGAIERYEFKADNTVTYYSYIPANANNEAIEREGTTTYIRDGNQLIIKNHPYPYTILISNENSLHLYDMFEVESEGTYIKTENITKFERIK